jgi:DNA-binding response OmpR family regulator
MRVLVVEDDLRTASLLRRGLTEEGYAVDIAPDGPQAVWRAAAFSYDAVVLDVMLPGMDGFDVCRKIRAGGCWAPVLMLTARGRWLTGSVALMRAPTTTWPSRLTSPSCAPGCGPW